MFQRYQYSGFSLLEVLLAWAIATTVIVAALKYQQDSLQQIHNSYYRSLALFRVYALQQRFITTKPNHRTQQFSHWQRINQTLLLRSYSYYQCQPHHCQIHLQWQLKSMQQLTETFIT